MALLDEFLPSSYRSVSPRRSRRQPQQPAEEPETSILSSVVRAPISGLAAVGNILDLPGSSVRDLIAGENPLDQWKPSNWTSSEGRTSGRDLARQHGFAGPSDNWGNFLGGLGLEIAFDPLTYLSGGASALGKAGKAAKSAGLADNIAGVASRQLGRTVGPREARFLLTPDDLIRSADEAAAASQRPTDAMGRYLRAGGSADDLAKPLGGNLGFGPFGHTTPVTLPYGQQIARGMDVVGEAVRYGKYSPIRPLAALFDKGTMGAVAPQSQKAFGELSGQLKGREAESRLAVADIAQHFERTGMFDVEKVARATSTTPQVAAQTVLGRQRAITDYLEGVAQGLPPDMAHLQPQIDQIRQTYDNLPQFEKDVGLKSPFLDDIIRYTAREPVLLGKDRTGNWSRAYKTSSPFQEQRGFRGHPGGTNVLQEMSLDPFFQPFREASSKRALGSTGPLTQAERKAITDHILNNYVASGALQLPTDPAQYRQALAHMVSTFGTLSPEHVKRGIPMFEPNPLKPFLSRVEHSARATGIAAKAQGLLAESAQPLGVLGDAPTVADVISRMPGVEAERFAELVIEQIGQPAKNIQQGLAGAGLPATNLDVLKEFGVPQQIGRDIEKVMRGFTVPEEVSPFLDAIDRFTSAWKLGVTALWPAFHSRNVLSGLYQNWIGDAFSFDSLMDAHNIQLQGKTITGLAKKVPLFKGMTDKQATDRLRQLMFAHDVSGYRHGFTPETLGEAVGNPFGGIPGTGPIFSKPPVGASALQQMNPLSIGALSDAPAFAGERLGRDVSQWGEGLNRGTAFIELLKQGVDPGQAAKRTLELQADYKNLSKFEKSVMRRAAPFYSFTRQMLPMTVEELVQRPGGKLGRTIMTVAGQREADEFTPDYVADTASIGIGKQPGGARRYLTSLGMMFEDPMQLLPLGSAGLQGSLLEAGSRLNPLAKMPLEWMTGETFFQKGPHGGRELGDLDPTLGRTVANVQELLGGEKVDRAKPLLGSGALEYLAGNLPTARAATTARTLTDPRKLETPLASALNLLTGWRVTDVSPAAQDQMLKTHASDLLKQLGGNVLPITYISDEEKARLSPADRAKAEAIEELLDIVNQRAKARAKARKK